jgi:hypothetical protein
MARVCWPIWSPSTPIVSVLDQQPFDALERRCQRCGVVKGSLAGFDAPCREVLKPRWVATDRDDARSTALEQVINDLLAELARWRR